MKRCIAILLLLVFTAGFTPVVKMMLDADDICLGTIYEDVSKSEAKTEKKDTKESILLCLHIPIQATDKFSYRHSSHILGDNPITEILTPPPNQG